MPDGLESFKVPHMAHEVELLRLRLAQARWPASLPGAPWHCGADVEYLREFCRYWQTDYDWPRRVECLNRIPQYAATVGGLRIVFWHIKAAQKRLRHFPLLLLHGWPGSQLEFEAIAQALCDREGSLNPTTSFDVIVPALPGFGFGGQPAETGWHADRIGDAFNHLMTKTLGYEVYGVQGGDWGTLIGTRMAYRHAAHMIGLHINMPFATPPPGEAVDPQWAARLHDRSGYLHLQNTCPDALTVGLSDSPMALAAWILEKFRSWSDCDGDLERSFSKDTLISNLMFYWLPNCMASATRLYWESSSIQPPLLATGPLSVPTGVARFPKEPFQVPRHWLTPTYPIVHWTDMPRGGHFPGFEAPGLLVADICKFFDSLPAPR